MGEYVAQAADRLGVTTREVVKMSLDELWLLEEAHVRNQALDASRFFHPLIGFLVKALDFSKDQSGQGEARRIQKTMEELAEYGLEKKKGF